MWPRRWTPTAVCWVSSRSRRPPAGYRDLHDWLVGFGELDRVGVEGTGAYGAGLARFLQRAGVEVIEVDRPNRQERRRNGKSDQLDAIEAARAALGGRCRAVAKTGDGSMEAMRALLVAKRSGRQARVRSLNQIRHLGFTAPDDLRARLQHVPTRQLAATTARLRPSGDVVSSCDQARAAQPRSAGPGPRRRDRDRRRRPRRARRRHGPRAPRAPRRRRRHRRHPARRRRRQPRTHPLRSRLGAPLRRRPDPGVLGQDHAGIASTPAATARRTTPSGASSSPA